ncbi:MAG: small acid-soluble spore protein H-type [Herbinix sp.]|jgi:small acid-soluble spore protein H (minor)|nr:small acid-soluble spore protein H-type [Herbinix sp.]
MNERRALEIADSPVMANVTYEERQVYIEEVNTSKNTASIHFLNQPANSQEVPLTHLVEGERIT